MIEDAKKKLPEDKVKQIQKESFKLKNILNHRGKNKEKFESFTDQKKKEEKLQKSKEKMKESAQKTSKEEKKDEDAHPVERKTDS